MTRNFIKNVRLSKHIAPIRYKINLAPDLDNFVFTGEEEIALDIRKETNSITLHAAEIEILGAVLVQNGKSQQGSVSYSKKDETATLLFKKLINPGKAVLKFKFTGILNDKLRGFYRSKYEVNGKTHHMAVSQFESTDARRAFPCFDEPAQKAVFEVNLKVPSDRTVISNTIEREILEPESGFKTVKFAPSPKMSSYLLAFIVGHFEHIKKKSKNGTLVRVFTTPGKKHQAEFALDVAVKCIEFYENYFAIKYPLPVMNLIAIPDFASGAMENWGAVTYRETAILVDSEHSSTQNKQWVALVIAHELAHQWFGNLVTMEWWTHLWLNEGFASYMEYVAIDKLFPKWNIWTQFVFIEHARGLALDGLASTHAIEVDVNHPAEISEIFDAVSYSKGASVIRMLAEYLGEKDFRAGLRKYLKKHAYSNARTNDLWDALEDISGKPVRRIMQNWTRKPGYPLISLYEDNGIKISQSRFYSSSNPKARDKTIWLTPLKIAGTGVSKTVLLKSQNMKLSTKSSWLKANFGETSFIRARYTAKMLEGLSRVIATKKLSEPDRFGVIRDAFALAQAGHISTDEVLKLTLSYKEDDSYIVWAQISEQILRLNNLLFDTPIYEGFRKFGRILLSSVVKKIGWEAKKGEKYDRALLRSAVIYSAGSLGDEQVIKKAKELFEKERSGKRAIDSDLRSAVYNIIAQNGEKREFEIFKDKFSKTTLEEEKDRIMRALCSFPDKKMLLSMLEYSFSKVARGQDTVKAIGFVWANPYGGRLTWEYLKSNWVEIVRRFGGGHLFSRFLIPAQNFKKKSEAVEVAQFFKAHPAEGIGRTVAQSVEQIRSNAAWLERDSEKIKKFLKSRY